MASMQHDFIHPRQLDDVRAIRAAIKSFTATMKRMMVLMKDLGTTLEQVSHSFDALTSLSFSDDGVKQYVHHFSEEVMHMMEGTAFRHYNKLVHEEVLVPVEQLRASLTATEKAAKAEKKDFGRYKKSKRKVDAQEKSYATKSKSLDTSKSYPTRVQTRDNSLLRLQRSKDDFETKFVGLVSEVEKVTATTLKRYLDLNAGYMTSVVDALTKTDPTVEEAVVLYREEQRQQRQSAIKQRCAAVDTEINAACVSQGYRLNPSSTNRNTKASAVGGSDASRGTLSTPTRQSASRLQPQPTPGTVAAAARNPSASSSFAPSPVKETATPLSSAPNGPPAAATASTQPSAATNHNAAQQGAFTVTTTATNARQAAPPADSAGNSRVVDDLDEDFGSASQVGAAGATAPPLYSFSRGPTSQVSSVRPPSGYVAAQDANLTNDFLRKMESTSLSASEVCAARAPQS
ncbi:hypothetical protein ABB37_09481 [Leptomonas pyrrhocoris]|uniref:BAR domain-containing protein n=1 Tax=Leptomonas pyrrhocoris TaxID=157538 RepID=A0A0N0DR18_LEPPY|nr:hypothetical protein ABB37_09481 [Leptomonas pyrrhocoris]XP_015652280.1 hypothetical protein ABB37_09481 [Leptomonas pyrrhocoris]KPA73840.1 hypothetical protein ABB37_09481 [Leptomonas pyrrhocoris]KPA73841.1 hypothetical protein ABB37_09481 [Leptomonas pyrrhocoris]|eukprot:XP_015652279.1 hypothetical protein ABB37_09481 [Leptomonas pyrrhocoris]